jgi:hypothetical protein
MARSSLRSRNDFREDSSFSTLRRSLGAILKEQLSLRAVPRGFIRSNEELSEYHFAAPGEENLSRWMERNLEYSYQELDDDIQGTLDALIGHYHPPLNLAKWNNPLKTKLMRLRKACKDEAELAALDDLACSNESPGQSPAQG